MPNALISSIRGEAGQASTSTGRLRMLLPVALLGLTACSSLNHYVPRFIQPYRADVQQGNWLTQDQVDLLRPGMTRDQVRFALGSPTLTSVFRTDRWDYPYLYTPGHGTTEERKFTVYFVDDKLDHWAGDKMPDRQPFQSKDVPKQPLTATTGTKPAAQGGDAAGTQVGTDGGVAPLGLDPSAAPTSVNSPTGILRSQQPATATPQGTN